jgi:hypothetical protein
MKIYLPQQSEDIKELYKNGLVDIVLDGWEKLYTIDWHTFGDIYRSNTTICFFDVLWKKYCRRPYTELKELRLRHIDITKWVVPEFNIPEIIYLDN